VHRPRIALGLALSLVALAAAGCGGGQHTSARNALADAAAWTIGAPGEQVSVRVSMMEPSTSGVTSFAGSGVMGANGGRLHFDLSPISGSPLGEIFVRSGGRLVLYMRSNDFQAMLAGSNQDPVQPLRLLCEAAKNVWRVGVEPISGEPMTHYRATVDLIRVARATGSKRAGLRALRREIGDPVQTIDAWVDARGYLRRDEVRMPARKNGTTLQMLTTTEFSRAGEAVHVAAPPEARTADLLALMQGGRPQSDPA
jgi:hypothetical protein